MSWPSEVTAAERQCLTCSDLFACVMDASSKAAAGITICMRMKALRPGLLAVAIPAASSSQFTGEGLRG